MTNYQILECDNALYLAILSGPERCDYFIPGIEDNADPIEVLINGLDNGEFTDAEFADWSPRSLKPRIPGKLYSKAFEQGAKVIADNNGVYPESMNKTGLKAFKLRNVAA